MKIGTLYGIGVGPGDPELITVKGARLLRQCQHVFVPKARTAAESVALSIAGRYLESSSQVHELIFPMTADQADLSRHWTASAGEIAAVLKSGEDACFLTLGDPLLYSTYIYLLRELKALWPEARVVTVPGVAAFSAAAALADFPVGEKKEPVTIIPTADDLEDVQRALSGKGTVILMKVGRRLNEVLNLLEEAKVMDRSVFVSHAGMENERVESQLRRLRAGNPEAGYLSIILVHAREKGS
jgi:precorrin-2/cobalt-factor-2 C20-methyltransferase